jgi:hypothetical protein
MSRPRRDGFSTAQETAWFDQEEQVASTPIDDDQPAARSARRARLVILGAAIASALTLVLLALGNG